MKNPTPTHNPAWLPEILNGPAPRPNPPAIITEHRTTALKYCGDLEAFTATLDAVTVRAQFCGMLQYFDSDTTARPVFLVTLTRGNRSASFPFGASLNDGQTINSRPALSGDDLPPIGGRQYAHHAPYNAALKAARAEFPASLLYSILCAIGTEGRNPGTFSDWCGEFGGNPDSMKDFKKYQDCCEMHEEIRQIFSADELQDFPS